VISLLIRKLFCLLFLTNHRAGRAASQGSCLLGRRWDPGTTWLQLLMNNAVIETMRTYRPEGVHRLWQHFIPAVACHSAEVQILVERDFILREASTPLLQCGCLKLTIPLDCLELHSYHLTLAKPPTGLSFRTSCYIMYIIGQPVVESCQDNSLPLPTACK